MNELEKRETGIRQGSLAEIEYRIGFHLRGVYENLLEVGRALCEAKDKKLVPHGEWEAWLRKTAGMSERSAQRLMQAAREVAPGSAMERLPITKIQAILALPEPEREAMAEKAEAEDMSLRRLREEVAGLKTLLKAAEKEQDALHRSYDDAHSEIERMCEANAELLMELEAAKAAPAQGISPEAQSRIEELERAQDQNAVELERERLRAMALEEQLGRAKKMAERQAEAREKAQKELTDLKSQAARGETAQGEDLTAESVVVAVRTFIGTMAFLPHTSRLATLRYQDREQIAAHVRMIGKWAAEMEERLNSVDEMVVVSSLQEEA